MGMRKHSRSHQRIGRNSTRPQCPTTARTAAICDGGFLGVWRELLVLFQPRLAKRRGRKPRVALPQLLAAMVFHFMNQASTLAEHFAMLFDDALADSSCASRRVGLPRQMFAELMHRTLRPLAQKRRHPTAFWRKWRCWRWTAPSSA